MTPSQNKMILRTVAVDDRRSKIVVIVAIVSIVGIWSKSTALAAG